MATRGVSTVNMAVFLLGLLVMAQQSMQQSLRNPIIKLKTDNCKLTYSPLGLILNSDNEEHALLNSGRFQPDEEKPYVDIAGRRFHLGSLDGNKPIIYVKTGGFAVNVATTLQILFDHFPSVFGIISIGSAGSLNQDKLDTGDVAVPRYAAFTGAWLWEKFGEDLDLIFGKYNHPIGNAQNLLGSVGFRNVTLFSEAEDPESVFWLPSNTQSWFRIAYEAFKDLELRQCFSGVCLTHTAKAVYGRKASTSDIYVKNKAYGTFLHEKFAASYSDTDGASIALTALSNGKHYIVFRGVSNIVGDGLPNSTKDQVSYIASENAVRAAAKFIDNLIWPAVACE